jgi:hypothetical protein
MTAPLRVLCCYVPGKLRPETAVSLALFAPTAEYVDVSASPDAYHALLAGLWAEGETFAVVEQDVEIHRGVLPQFAACSEPWCTFAYEVWLPPERAGDPPRRAAASYPFQLMCSRFRAPLLRKHPDIVSRLQGACRHWLGLDAHIGIELQRRGVPGPHVHQRAIRHHHQADAEEVTRTRREIADLAISGDCLVCRGRLEELTSEGTTSLVPVTAGSAASGRRANVARAQRLTR